ncbi:AIPR family protein [Listeria booriae]|nr:AIPR family protein [Listeria booriae]
MGSRTEINNPIIESYVSDFIEEYELSNNIVRDQHSVFEMYINNLVLSLYGNDPIASYEDMETGTAFGIDGVAILVADRLVTSIEDVDQIIDGIKKFDVEFIFTQSKTVSKFNRQDINDFFTAVRRFFNFSKCEIPEVEAQWEVAVYIYSKSSKHKKLPSLSMIFASLSPVEIDKKDPHMSSAINLGTSDLVAKGIFDEAIDLNFIGIKEIMNFQNKLTSGLEITVSIDKQLVPYPRGEDGKIKNAYYGLIKIENFIEILTDEVGDKRTLRKGIFNDNIRYYLGSDEKIEVNSRMKEQLSGKESFLFGLLNNGVTVISDEVNINSDQLTLINYQIVNGCQTSNVIFEALDKIKEKDIYIPIRLIATEDEDSKNAIIKATNSQTALKPEQLVALLPVQKAIEKYYDTKRKQNSFLLYYERRTEQYRDDEIQKTKIVNIPFQIKATSALFLDLPHEVSGQYGKVERSTRGKLFKDLSFLNAYYVSGLAWYRVESFVRNNEEGKKFRRARWHIIMLLKYLMCPVEKIDGQVNKNAEQCSVILEGELLDELKSMKLIESCIEVIKECFKGDNILSERKLFERKETTIRLIEYAREHGYQTSKLQESRS